MSTYVKTPTIYQMEATECGAASLAMIFGYFGKYLPLEQMRIETGVSRDGCNAANIMRAAKRFGLECHGYRKEPEALRDSQPPCIIHWNFEHFVVFEGFKGEYAYINDPAMGRRKLSWEDLDDSFTGVVLTFKLTDSFQKEKKPRGSMSFIRDRLRGNVGVLFKLFYIGLLLVFPGLVLPVLSQVLMDDILIGGYTDWLVRLLVFMGALVLLRAGLSYYRGLVLARFNAKLTTLSGYGFLRHMLRLPVSFFDQRYAGDLVERMDSNTSVNEFLSGELAETVLNIFVAVFYLVVLLFYSPVMTLIGLVNVAVCFTAVALSSKAIAGASMKLQISAGKLYSTVCAGLNITDSIKASGTEAEYSARVLGFQAKAGNLQEEMGRYQQLTNAIPSASGKITDALLLLVGGLLVIRGHMTLGMLLAFNSLFDSFFEPVSSLVGFVQKIQELKADLSRVNDITAYAQDDRYGEKAEKASNLKKLSGDIELRDLSFGYSRLKPPLVENFSFRLRSGESIAFVGASGCGKSTVSKMVSGLYKPWSGEILLDGEPVENIPRAVLNASIATVSQNIVLFSGTVRENLTMWNDAILEEDMIRAAKDACIHDFIMQQKEGYDFVLSEGASNLSGGQRQRLEIARALTGKPTILVMDEATSALDPITEKKVLDNISRRGCTCVIVAHRLSAIRDCKQILVMSNGKIVQRGTHDSLKDADGYYRRFVENL